MGAGASATAIQQIDAATLNNAIPYLHLLWSGPLQLIVSLLLLYNFLGPSGFAGFIVMGVSMPLSL